MAVCSTVMPAAHADLCDPQTYYGEISMLMFTRRGDSLTDWTSAAEWDTRIDNDATGVAALPDSPALAVIRQLFGIGTLGAPDRPEIKISRNRKVYGSPDFTMTFEVEDTGDTNWDFMRGLPAGGQQYSAWFGTEERLFGGNDGIPVVIVADPSIPQSNEELQKIIVNVSWKSTIPEVTDNILA